jgi:hypothetical protein
MENDISGSLVAGCAYPERGKDEPTKTVPIAIKAKKHLEPDARRPSPRAVFRNIVTAATRQICFAERLVHRWRSTK